MGTGGDAPRIGGVTLQWTSIGGGEGGGEYYKFIRNQFVREGLPWLKETIAGLSYLNNRKQSVMIRVVTTVTELCKCFTV